MKWLKRLLLLVVFLGVFAVAAGAIGVWLARGTPGWYARPRGTPQQLAAAAHRAEEQVQRTLSWASGQAHHSPDTTAPAPSSDNSLQISLSEDEVNGFFAKWDQTFGWSGHYSRYLSDPQIVIEDGRLILAGAVKDLGSVMSIEFAPRLANGKLYMPVQRVLAGRLPLPQAFWDGYRRRLEQSVLARLPEWQARTEVGPDGTANSDAVAAAMGEMLLNVLNDRPTDPVLFLPYSIQQNHRSLPVKLTGVQVADKMLTLTVEPMNAVERQTLVERIRVFPAQVPRD